VKKKYAKIIVIILIAAVIIISVKYSGEYLSWDALQKNKQMLKDLTAANYLLSAGVFIGVYIVCTAFSIPGAVWLTIGGGFLFGAIPNLVYTNISATIGATAVFLTSRYLIGGQLQEKYSDKLKRFNKEIEDNGNKYLLSVRLIPVFPFWLINIMSGLTKLPLKTYIIYTSIGMIPGGFVYSYAGSRLSYVDKPEDLFSRGIAMALLMLGLLIIMPGIIKKAGQYFKNKRNR